jgi:hypothetical protein
MSIPDYQELFLRNYGVFTQKEQDRIRTSRVLIIGCGGIGGTVAIILARSGVSRFILVEFDDYGFSNMNRQIACFTDTLGRNKAVVLKEQILKINPEAQVEVYPKLLTHDRLSELIPKTDMVFPAADDLAFSVIVFREAQRLGVPALLVFPSGTWANVCILMPDSPPVEEIEGVPRLESYEELKAILAIRKYKFGTYFYVPFADWRIDYYRAFIEEDISPAHIAPSVWLCSSLGSLEVLKVLSGKWKPVKSPHYWNITKNGIRINRIGGLNLQTLLVWQRKIMWRLFQTRLSTILEVAQEIWWKLFVAWAHYRERREKQPR